MSGFDYEVGTSLANAPWLSLYASGFHYDNKYKEDENGYRLRSKMQLTPRLSMEMGYTNSNLTSGSLYGKVLYQLADTAGPALRGGSAKELSNDISHKLLQKVQRENEIKTETFTKLVAYTGSLSVTVTSSGADLQGAQVQAYQNGSPVGAIVVTDVNGKAELSGLAAGEYTVRATYFNISDDSPTVTVQKDQTTTVPPIALAVVGGKAKITVLDNAGAGVGGATVTAEETSGLHGAADKSFFDRILGVKTAYAASGFKVTAVTGANGIATFTDLPPGNYKFTVTYSGKEMKSLSVSVANDSTSSSTVVLPSSGGNIVAMISDAVGKAAIKDATVELKNGSTVIDTKTTGSDGTAVFSGLTVGSNYTVTARAANYSDKGISTTVTDKETIAAELALTPLAPQTANVTITVIDYDDKQPIGGATVTATLEGVTISTTNTTSDGKAIFENLTPGHYNLKVTKVGYSRSELSTNIEDTTSKTIELILPKGQITITVKGTDGKPISGVAVSTMVEIGDEIKPVTETTNASGIAKFTKLPTGTYTFTATEAGYDSNTTAVTVLGANKEAGTITLSPKLITAQVNVKDGDEKNVAWYANVRVTGNGVDQTKTTDASGNVTFSLPAGEYLFAATYKYDGYYTNDSKTVVLSDETSSVNLTMVRKVGNLTLIVKDRDSQQPISGAEIFVSYSDPKNVLGYTDGEGKLTLTNVPTGTYAYTATKYYYQGMIYSAVTVNEGTNEQVIELPRALGKAQVTVKNVSGSTLSNATVTLEGGTSKTTNTYGYARFDGVPAGEVVFSASMDGYASQSVTATIPPGNGTYDPYTAVEIILPSV
ncbi:MAG: putative invasin [Sporomusa sp.]|nr:putative invasin [Sporomusa sp.]